MRMLAMLFMMSLCSGASGGHPPSDEREERPAPLEMEVQIERGPEVSRLTVFICNNLDQPVEFPNGAAGGPGSLNDGRTEPGVRTRWGVGGTPPTVTPVFMFRYTPVDGGLVNLAPPTFSGATRRGMRPHLVTVPAEGYVRYASFAVPSVYTEGEFLQAWMEVRPTKLPGKRGPLELHLAAEELTERPEPPLIERAQRFRAHLGREQYDAARAMMTGDARRWWESRPDAGEPWQIGPDRRGPWADWDDHFRARKEIVEWREGPRSASVLIRETNDYFQLLARGWVTSEVRYFFDEEGLIEGLLIRAIGNRPPGRTEEFLTWAKQHEPEKIAELMPGGEIDPTGDHPSRFRRLLERWRRAKDGGTIE